MKKKVLSLILLLIVFMNFSVSYTYGNEKGKTIVINMNRTNLEYMDDIPTLKKELQNRGYVGLMNIRGDKGTDDERAYATIGAGGRANVSPKSYIDFREATEATEELYKSVTNKEPKAINNMGINKAIADNVEKGQYGSTLGAIGQTLAENNLSVAVIGNADIGIEKNELNRNIGLMAMDNFGRIEKGNIEDINIKDNTMPFGIRTNYDKLIDETKKYYQDSDVIFIELGDTYRLDLYKSYLNDDTLNTMRGSIYKNIDKYLSEVLNLVNENDKVYVISAFPSTLDYKNRRRLSPVIKFDGEGKGLLKSATTRRDGIVANVDIGVDILNNYELKNNVSVGKSFGYIDKENNIEFLDHEYEKIVSIANIRANVVNTFVGVISASWVIAMALLFIKNKIPKEKQVFKVLKEFIKLGMIMPLAFLVAPIFNFSTPTMITVGILGTTLAFYILGTLLFKDDDIKQMGLYAFLVIAIIAIDSVFGTYLMQNNIMSYDSIIGARYYGIGNEYEGVTIGSAVFALAVLLNYRKIPKWLACVLSIVILITSAYPAMGANVGGAISESVAYILFILLIFDVKLDFKKIILLGLSAVGVVVLFAILDIISGSESHLSLFINQIITNGPSAIIQTFARKIAMNMKLAQTSVWVNILLVGILIVAALIFRPTKHFKYISDKYPIIFKGFIASMVGCIVTLLVNDSGIVAASTASIYILIPLIIITINMVIFKEEN